MRIGIDGSHWENRRGFGRFTRNVVRKLAERPGETTYVLLIDEATAAAADLPAAAEHVIVRTTHDPLDGARSGSYRSPLDVLRFTRAARGSRLDAMLFTTPYTWFPTPGIATVLGIHDTIVDDLPTTALPSVSARVLWKTKQRLALRAAKRIFTVSKASRAALARRYHLDPSSILIVPEAPDPVFRPLAHSDARALIAPFGVTPEKGFLLYAGGISPHKNVEGLVAAYASAVGERPDLPPLVVVGDLESEAYASSARSVRERIALHDLRDRVLLPGFVSDEALGALYSSASVVVLPSLAEGFGLPAVEAAACGAPVILSDLPSHRESLGAAGWFVPPGDTDALARALLRLLDDPKLRARLAAETAAAVAHLTWDAAADMLDNMLAEVAG